MFPRTEAQALSKVSSEGSPLDRRWPWLIRLFSAYARRYLRKHFHSVRLARQGGQPELPDGPLVVALTHPSWWDPLMGIALTERLPGRAHVVPIEAAALQHYRFFERLGFFGIEPGTRRGYERLLEVADQVLTRRDACFWITPQGHFADVRSRPLSIRPGVGHLAQRLRGGAILPVALEYSFWDDRLPEALARFGEPIPVEDGATESVETWRARVEDALGRAQDELSRDSQSRAPDRFEELLRGRAGVGGLYDLWRRVRAALSGKTFVADHGDITRGALRLRRGDER